MNRNTPSPVSDPPDDLDRMLAAYFKAQVPQDWPPAPMPKSETSARTWPHDAPSGRFTLAVSVACLLGLGLALSYAPNFQAGPDRGEGLLRDSKASGDKLQPHMAPDHQPKLPTP